MSRRVRDRCFELERAIAARFRSGSLGLDDAIKLFDELLPIARPASVCAFNQILTVVSRAQGRGSSPSSNGWSVPPQIRYRLLSKLKLVIICFTSSGHAARLISKYRPSMPVLSVVIPANQLRWSFTGAFEATRSLIVRGLFPMLADPRHPAGSTSATNESVLKVAFDQGQASGAVKSLDRVVCQKVGDSLVAKIIELDD